MCGIAVAVGAQDGAPVATMLSALRHRGPDGTQQRTVGSTVLGATRLAIVDPTARHIVLQDESGSVTLAFNGEIYNHRELRDELVARGHTFRTRTDTEVVVHLLEESGTACLPRLRGMFALAVAWDDEVVVARDRLGIKPVYWATTPSGGVLCASEVKALLRVLPGTPTIDMQTFADVCALGHAVGPETWFEGIHLLEPGHLLRVNHAPDGPATVLVERWAQPVARQETMPYEEAELRLDELLDDAVRRHLDADVEVGLTLSGGLDSTVLALVAASATDRPLRTFTVADHPGHPDVVLAEAVAKVLRVEHRTLLLDDDLALDAVPRLVAAEEGPASLFGLPFQVLCEHIGQDLRACLHGEGADEIFGGYPQHVSRDHRARALQRRLPRLARLGLAPSERAIDTITRLTAGPDETYVETALDIDLGDPLQRLHLEVVDRCAMSVGLEMRVPYLDDELAGFVRTVPTRHLVRRDIGVRKYLLRRLALRRFGALGPEVVDVVLREKLGAPSAGVLVLQRFDERCERVLPDDYLERHELGAGFGDKRSLLMFEYFRHLFVECGADPAGAPGVLEFMAAQEGARP